MIYQSQRNLPLNDEMEKEVSGELKKARALMKLGQNLGEPLDAEESLNDLPESGKEPLHDILKRAAEESMSDVEDSVNYIIDSLTSSTKKELEDKSAKSEVYESLEELLTKDKLNKINDLKKALDLLSKNTTAKKNDRDKALDELLAKDELAEISKRSGALEVLLPKDTIKEVRDVKRNPNELLAKHEINKISDVEGVLKELIPRDNIMKRSDVQVLGKLLAEDEIVKIKRADEPIETEGVLESLPKQISKRSEVKEVHQELLPGGKLTNVGETDEFLELIAEGKLIKDSLKLPKSMDSLPDEEEVVKELTELLQSSKDRHKKELLPDPELPELRRSRRNDKTSSEESIVKELIDDIQLQTKKARKLPRIRARAITALPSRDLHALGEDASEPEGPGDHRQTRSNAGEHGLQELSPGALEDDSSLLEPLVQGSGEGTRRRRSVSETNDLELRHSADRFSRYERETANEQAGEGPKKPTSRNL
ncbi:uncharacterized protein LOC119591594 [Penaeus monodon]|uniref:uncharacterized protein LOC119591594 n=1 Tax=Penaeus monodon TaxID=6687 RepID=UPI0018A7C6C4|nr:uncharacterized protein LOC119591594 [Penaeus monodon]